VGLCFATNNFALTGNLAYRKDFFMTISILDHLNASIGLLSQTGINEADLLKLTDLKTRLGNRELTIAVIGQFKRGKTSFINTLLKKDILPVGIIPVTSVVTKIQYGTGYANISFQDGHQETPSLSSLGNYISEQENPVNEKGVSCVKLYLPCDFLKEGMILVDTPGVGSIHQHNTDEAYSILQDSDAIIFMLSVDSPINEIEREFLLSAKEYASKFYFAVNKIDTINQTDLQAYLKYCEGILSEIMAMTIDLYPISAREKTGIELLFSTIRSDIRDSAEDILAASVQIKLRDRLTAASSHLALYLAALNMPLTNLETKKKELDERLINLDQMISESHYLLAQKVDDLLNAIKTTLQYRSKGVVTDLSAIMKTSFEKVQNEKSRDVEAALIEVVDTQLEAHLNALSEDGLKALKQGYEEIAGLLNDKIDGLKSYLEDSIQEIFGITCHYEKNSHQLSEREDFYVKVNVQPGAFLVDLNKLVFLMPRRIANQKLLERLTDQMKNDVEKNINNMIYNYQYKIRESVRSLKSILAEESRILKKDIEDLLDRVIAEKQQSSLELGKRVGTLNQILTDMYHHLEDLQ
jgi:small GTP-binding protein